MKTSTTGQSVPIKNVIHWRMFWWGALGTLALCLAGLGIANLLHEEDKVETIVLTSQPASLPASQPAPASQPGFKTTIVEPIDRPEVLNKMFEEIRIEQESQIEKNYHRVLRHIVSAKTYEQEEAKVCSYTNSNGSPDKITVSVMKEVAKKLVEDGFTVLKLEPSWANDRLHCRKFLLNFK